MLTSKALRLGQSIQEGQQPEFRYRPPIQLSEADQAKLSVSVTELNLSVRARKCMNRLGINSLGDLVQRTADELLESKNFGMTSRNEVREKLAQFALTLRGDCGTVVRSQSLVARQSRRRRAVFLTATKP